EAIGKAGMRPGGEIYIALDVASSELWAGGGRYTFRKSGEPDRTSDQMIQLYEDWLRQYPIVSIEDGLAEGDWSGWKSLTDTLGSKVQLVGDDVFVTNPDILKRGISEGIANALLVKLNQTGPAAPRRKHLEQGKPVHRLDRCGSVGPRPRGSRGSRTAPQRRRLHVRSGVHIGAEARDSHALDRHGRAGSAVDSRDERLAAERTPLRRAAGIEQGGNRGQARRRP